MKNRIYPSVLLCLCSTSAYAQNLPDPSPATKSDTPREASPPEDATTDAEGLSDIVVTATRRSERLQNVAVAVTAVSADQLAQNAIITPSDLKVPGVQFVTESSRSQLSVRGVSSGGNPGFDQAVPIFIDGVYFGRGGTARGGFLDVERLEILRGPQPTYLGKNAIAGALSVVSRRPGDKLEGNITAFHEFEAKEENVEAGLTVPVTNTLSTRFAGRYRDVDGWVRNVALGNDGPSVTQWSGRASALWRPDDAFHLYAKYDHTTLHASGTARELFNCGVLRPVTAAVVSSNDDCKLDGRTASSFVPALFPLVPARGGSDPGFGRFKLSGGEVEAGYDAGGFVVTATGAVYKLNMFDRLDVDGSDRQYSVISTFDDSNQRSVELKAASTSRGRFSWLAGAYADAIDLKLRVPGGVWVVGGGDPRFAPGPGFFLDVSSRQEERSWSIYGEAGYEVVDGLTVKLAGRYSNIEKTLRRFDVNSNVGIFDPASGSVTVTPATVYPRLNIRDDKRKFRDLQPAVTVEYRPRGGILLFASYKEGFKAGGFDLDAFFVNPTGNTQYDPESVEAYEAGAKLNFLGGKARLNLTAFRSDYSDLQVNIFNGVVGSYTANAATARSQGIEVEAQVAPTRGLVLSGTLNYLDSKYGSFPLATCFPGQTVAQGCTVTQGGSFQSLNGKERIYAPKWSGTLGFEYNGAMGEVLGRDAGFRAGANAFLTSKYTTYSVLGPFSYQDGYATLDGHVGVTFDEERYQLSLIGRNLTNERIYDAYQPTAAGGNRVFSATLRRTRQIALQLAAKF